MPIRSAFQGSRAPRAIAALVVSAFAMLVPAELVSAQARPVTLFSDAASMVVDHPGDMIAVKRRRPVQFDEAGLDALRLGKDLRLNLFNDVSLPVLVDDAWQSHVDTWHWQGHVPGEAKRTVILVLHKGLLWGTVNAPNVGDFRFGSRQNLGQVVEEIDQNNFLPCGCGKAQSQENRGPLKPVAPGQVNGQIQLGNERGNEGGIAGFQNCPGPLIDVMVVYSPEAAAQQGGTAAMEAIILGLEDATNLSYLNSNVAQRIRIVHMAETASELTGFNATLSALTDTADGTYDEVHALRDQYGADMVAMLISHTNGGICGIGWLMGDTEINTAFAQYAFTVTNVGCATGGFTFQHELGHNMGCHHDHDNAGGSPAFPWSYGHRFTGDNGTLYRTIMSYAPGSRIGYFSNPNILYQGQPTGVPQGTVGTQADNAASLNATGPVVAQFRATVPFVGGTSWPAPALLSQSDFNAGDRFGSSVAIDGQVAIIGAYTDDQAASDAGAAYIFKFNAISGVWEEEAKLVAPDAAINDRFGIAVDIVDGADDVAVIGSYLDDDAGRDCGSAYVFRRSGANTWAYEGKVKSTDLAGGDSFGRSVAIAGDAICVGAPNDDDGGSNSGSAYIFRKTGSGGASGGWTQEQKLVAADPAANDNFGQSVDLGFAPNGDGYAIAGNWHDDDIASNAGSAYVYRKVGAGSWTQLPKLVANDAATEDQAGFAVAISFPDATTRLALVGAWKDDGLVSNSGAVYVYADSGAGFTQETKIVASDSEAEANFGVAIDADADELIVGAYTDDAGALDAGAAYVYRRGSGGWSEDAKLSAPNAVANDQMGFAVAIDGTLALAGAWQRDNPDAATGNDAGGAYLSGGTGGGPITDCNHNGVADECDVATGTSADVNGNGIPDECELPQCPGDVNGDHNVNVSDLLSVISHWGPCGSPPIGCVGDVAPVGPPTGDGQVNVSDLLLVIARWGACP